MPIRDLYRCSQEHISPGVQPNQIAPRHRALILCGYWYAGRPIRGPLFLFNKRLGLSLPRVLTNQMLDLHEAGDHNTLLKTKSRHLIGQSEYLDSSTILMVTWCDLIGLHSWLQIAYRHDTRPFLPLAKGLALLTILKLGPVYLAEISGL